MGLFSRKKSSNTVTMRLRGFPADPATNKCLLMAAEKGIRLDTELLDIAAGACDGPEYRQLSPFGKAPCLKQGNFVISGAQAILAYMDIRGQGTSLNPKKAALLGEQNYWVDVAQRFIDPHVSTLAPWRNDAEAASSEEDKQAALNEISRVMDTLDALLADGRRFIAGEYSFADIHWTASMHLCVLAGQQQLIDSRPNLQGWYERVKTHTSKVNQKQTHDYLASLDEIHEKRLKSVA